MCVTSDTSATDALNLMVSRGFRHLVRKRMTIFNSRFNSVFFFKKTACL